MIRLITSNFYGEFVDELAEMHRLRFRIFKERLGWEVQIAGDMEIDEFDALRPAYLLLVGQDGRVQGCVRLLPTQGPTMLRDTFPVLLGGQHAPEAETVWESSRFGLDIPAPQSGATGVGNATYALFAGMIEFGLSRRLTDIVTVTDVRMERILRRAGWPLRRLSDPRTVGTTLAVAGYLEISSTCLARVRQLGGIKGPVVWAPLARAA